MHYNVSIVPRARPLNIGLLSLNQEPDSAIVFGVVFLISLAEIAASAAAQTAKTAATETAAAAIAGLKAGAAAGSAESIGIAHLKGETLVV